MILDNEKLRRLQHFYGSRTMELMTKWADKTKRIGFHSAHDRWVDRDGSIVTNGPEVTQKQEPFGAVLILRQPKFANVTQVRFTPLSNKPRSLQVGEWFEATLDRMLRCNTHAAEFAIPYQRTLVEIKIELEEPDEIGPGNGPLPF